MHETKAARQSTAMMDSTLGSVLKEAYFLEGLRFFSTEYTHLLDRLIQKQLFSTFTKNQPQPIKYQGGREEGRDKRREGGWALKDNLKNKQKQKTS